MFELRAIIASASVFVLVCAAMLLVLRSGWPVLSRLSRRLSKSRVANLLFGIQVAPVVCGAVAALCFALPSFLRFEPPVVEEEFGGAAVVLAAAGLCFACLSAWRTVTSLRQMQRATAAWKQHGCADHTHAVPVYQAKAEGLLAVAGVGSQTLFVSRDVATTLTADELKRAIAHELVHVDRRDNLAKLAVLACRLPGMRAIENAWHEAVEMTADELAVRNRTEALDLASALVKVSRLKTQQLPQLASGFAALAGCPLAARIERLLAWQEDRAGRRHAVALYGSYAAIACTVIAAAVAYQPILLHVHQFTEWLLQ